MFNIKSCVSIALILITFASAEFPLKDVLGRWERFVRRAKVDLDTILCTKNTTTKYGCRCDDQCSLTNECCMDKFWDPNVFENVEDYFNFLIIRGKQKADKLKIEVERDVLPKHFIKHLNVTFKTIVKLHMIDECKAKATTIQKQHCEDETKLTSQYVIPVQSRDGTMYKNSFCAECNEEPEYEYLNITITCPISSTDCVLGEVYSSKRPSCGGRPCHNKEGSRIHDLCHSYAGIVKEFPNFHCGLCSSFRKKCSNSYRLSWSIVSTLKRDDHHVTHRIRVTSGNTNIAKGTYEVQFCSDNKIYDATTKSCVDFTCHKDFQKVGRRCVKPKQRKADNCTINYATTKNIETMTVYVEAKKDTPFKLLKIVLNNVFNLKGQKVVENVSNDTYVIMSDNQTIIDNVQNALEHNAYIWNYVKSIYTSGYGIKREFKKSFLDVHKSCAVVSDYVNASNYTHNCKILSALMVEFSDSNEIKESVAYCKSEYLKRNCPLRFVGQMDYFIESNLTLYEHSTGERYVVEEYKPEEGGVSVCVQQLPIQQQSKDWKEIVSIAESYITIIGTATSIFAVAFLFVFLVKDNEELTVPKLNNILLCIVLLLSDCLFLSSIRASQEEKVCQAVAIGLHWSLLALHFVVAVISWDFTMRVAQLKASRQYQKRKIFYKYLIVTLLVPTVIIAISVTLDKTHLQYFGYGKIGNMCWIEDFSSRLVSYIVPTIFLCFASGVMLMYALRQIHTVGSQNQSVMNRKQRKRYGARRIALKLVFFLGLLEIISIVQIQKPELTQTEEIVNAIFRMMFVTLRSFRGVIIWFFLFLCNTQKNVMKNLKNLSASKLSLSRRFSAS